MPHIRFSIIIIINTNDLLAGSLSGDQFVVTQSLWYLPFWAVSISKFQSAVLSLCLDQGHKVLPTVDTGRRGAGLAPAVPLGRAQAWLLLVLSESSRLESNPEQSCRPTKVSESKASGMNMQPFSFMHNMPEQLSFLQI